MSSSTYTPLPNSTWYYPTWYGYCPPAFRDGAPPPKGVWVVVHAVARIKSIWPTELEARRDAGRDYDVFFVPWGDFAHRRATEENPNVDPA